MEATPFRPPTTWRRWRAAGPFSDFASEVFGKVDLLATPTIPTCLPTLAETDIDHGPPGTEQKFMAVSVNTRPFNYLGLPAASAPCGFDPNGLPIGLQIAGRPFAEARVLKAVDAYQRDTDWHRAPAGGTTERARAPRHPSRSGVNNAELIVETLRAAGVSHGFGIPAGTSAPARSHACWPPPVRAHGP